MSFFNNFKLGLLYDLRCFVDFYTKKEHREWMIRALLGIVFIWLSYLFNWGII